MSPIKAIFEISPLDAPSEFQSALGEWFDRSGKDLPWRRTQDPYSILISEVMLQQTRVAHVLEKGYFSKFLQTFPTPESLAKAEDEILLKTWEGLGYYRRARMLRSLARILVETYQGIFPEDEKHLLTLPGIGSYTAAALLSFAFGKPSSLVDGNVHRVLSRLMDDDSMIDSPATQKRHRDWAGTLCDPINPRRHHYAMMELGQTICRVGMPDCLSCPVSKFCKTKNPQNLPHKKRRTPLTDVEEHAIYAKDEQDRILLHQEIGSRRKGLWKLPLRDKDECLNRELIHSGQYMITRYKVKLHIYAEHQPKVLPGDEWITEEKFHEIPMASPYRKALNQLLLKV